MLYRILKYQNGLSDHYFIVQYRSFFHWITFKRESTIPIIPTGDSLYHPNLIFRTRTEANQFIVGNVEEKRKERERHEYTDLSKYKLVETIEVPAHID